MPKITIQTDIPGGETGLRTLSERIVADNLDSHHYAAQLIERITWAFADAEALESRTETAELDARPHAAAPATRKQAFAPRSVSADIPA